MNRLLYILIILILTLSSCTKHTEIVYESIDFRDSYWLAYCIFRRIPVQHFR